MANIPFAIGQNQESLGLLAEIYPNISGQGGGTGNYPYGMTRSEAVKVVGQIRAAYGLSPQISTAALLQQYVYNVNPAPPSAPAAPTYNIASDAALGIIRDASGNIVHSSSDIINETARAQDLANIQASAGTTTPTQQTQPEKNIEAANTLLDSINLKIAGKLPLTGAETYASLLSAKSVLESSIKAESKATGVSASYGQSKERLASLISYGQYKDALNANMANPELQTQYSKGKVMVGGAELSLTPEYQKTYLNAKTLDDYRNLAIKKDVEWVTGLSGSNLDFFITPKEGGGAVGLLADSKASYFNLLERGIKEAKESRKPVYVGGLGITLEPFTVSSTVLELNEKEIELDSAPTNIDLYLDLGEGLSSDEVTAISKMELNGDSATNLAGYVKKRAGNIISVTKSGNKILNVSTEPFEIMVKEQPKQPEIMVKEQPKQPEIYTYKGVSYTKSGKTFSTLMSEEIFKGMNALQESNRLAAIKLDNGTSWNEQILNVPREFAIDFATGLGTKTPLSILQAFKAGALSLDLQFKLATTGSLTPEEWEILPRIQEETRIASFESLVEPAKIYAFNKIIQGLPKVGEWGGNQVTKLIGANAASNLIIRSSASAASAAELSAVKAGNQYVLGQFAKQTTQTLVTWGLIGSGAVAGVEITTDETGGTSFGFNAPRAVGGVLTMGGFVAAANAVTSIGNSIWNLKVPVVNVRDTVSTASKAIKFTSIGGKLQVPVVNVNQLVSPKTIKWNTINVGFGSRYELPSPFVKSSLVNLKQGAARELTGQNTASEIRQGKLLAKAEASALIEAQKVARANYKYYSEAADYAPPSQRYGFQYRANRAKADVMRLQTEIAKYVKQPESVSIVSNVGKQKVGLLGEYKWGTSTITTVTRPDAMGRMKATTTSVKFKPESGGVRRVEVLGRVVGYDTNKLFGFEYPTGGFTTFKLFGKAPPKVKSSITPTPPAPSRSGTTTSGVMVGSGEAQTQVAKVFTNVNVAIAPRITTVQKVAPKVIVTPKVETKTVGKTKVAEKVIAKTEVKVKPLAKYAVNYNVVERVGQKVATLEKVGEKVVAKEIVREKVATKVAVKSLIRERLNTKVVLRQRLRERITERPKLLPPSAKFNLKVGKPLKMRFGSKGKKKKPPYAYADLLNVARSQRLFGAGTSPSAERPQTQEAIRKYGYRLQTAEQLKYGDSKRNNYKFGNRIPFGGLKL